MLRSSDDLNIKIFADGADLSGISDLAGDPLIAGFTTNPTLMRQSGIADYEHFAHSILGIVRDRPVSFEVFSDDEHEMERQARLIASWASNVYVKIPVTNTTGVRSDKLIRRLTEGGVKLNVTALMTLKQVAWVTEALTGTTSAIVSVFAGRIADTGRDPIPLMSAALHIVELVPGVELLWASPREILNIVQADSIGCHIITVTHDLLKKLPSVGRDLESFSLDTVRMFHEDARHAGYGL